MVAPAGAALPCGGVIGVALPCGGVMGIALACGGVMGVALACGGATGTGTAVAVCPKLSRMASIPNANPSQNRIQPINLVIFIASLPMA